MICGNSVDNNVETVFTTDMTNAHEIEEQEFGRSGALWDADPEVCCAAFQLGACEHTEAPYEDPEDLEPVERPATGTDWKARMSEANDAIGAARDALRNAKNWSEKKVAEKDLTFWLQQKAHVEGWLRRSDGSPSRPSGFMGATPAAYCKGSQTRTDEESEAKCPVCRQDFVFLGSGRIPSHAEAVAMDIDSFTTFGTFAPPKYEAGR